MTFVYNNIVTSRTRCYYAWRFFLHKKRWLLRLAQVLRASIVLGPARKPLVRYYQKFRHNDLFRTDIYPVFPEVDTEQLVARIQARGYAHVGNVPEHYVVQILDYCARHKQTLYWNPHTDCEAVRRICRNATIVEIARKYLGTEPILWLTLLKWSFPLSDDRADFHPPPHREPPQYDGHVFHYDILDFKSLTLFIYLTDIDTSAGAHIVIEGTHNNKTWQELRTIILDDDLAKARFGERIKVIVGKKGTAFFEETSTYHKVEVCQSRRLPYNVTFVY